MIRFSVENILRMKPDIARPAVTVAQSINQRLNKLYTLTGWDSLLTEIRQIKKRGVL